MNKNHFCSDKFGKYEMDLFQTARHEIDEIKSNEPKVQRHPNGSKNTQSYTLEEIGVGLVVTCG